MVELTAWRLPKLGTTAERVVREGHCPVLVVQGTAARPYRRLLAAVELPPETSLRSVDLGMRLVGTGAKERRVVHVRDDSLDRYLEQGLPLRALHAEQRRLRAEVSATLQSWVHSEYGRDLRWRLTVHSGDPRIWILAAARRHVPDLICLGTHARRGLERVFFGSVAQAVLRQAKCDVLIAPPYDAL